MFVAENNVDRRDAKQIQKCSRKNIRARLKKISKTFCSYSYFKFSNNIQ